MTDIDIERLRDRFCSITTCQRKCIIYNCRNCAILTLIERLEKAEARRDRLEGAWEDLLERLEDHDFCCLGFAQDLLAGALENEAENKTDE